MACNDLPIAKKLPFVFKLMLPTVRSLFTFRPLFKNDTPKCLILVTVAPVYISPISAVLPILFKT